MGEAMKWFPIDTAPYEQEVRVKVGEMSFCAMLVQDAGMNERYYAATSPKSVEVV